MGYFISFFLIIFSFLKKDSKILFVLMLSWMWLLFTFNYDNADYEMYRNIYEGHYGSSEILFSYLCRFFYNIGFSFEVFRGIYCFVCLILIGTTINKYSNSKNISLVLYFLFPFILDAVQIRHFMAISIITYALPLLNENSKKNYIKYIILNLIAVGFHYATLFYFIFIFIKKLSLKKVAVISIVLNILMIIFIKNDLIVKILLNILPENKVNIYFISDKLKSSNLLLAQCFLIQIFIFVVIYICYYIYIKNNNQNIENNNIKNQINFFKNTLKINMIISILNPAYYYNLDLIRIFRGISVPNYIVIGNTIDNKNSRGNLIPVLMGLFISMLMFWFLIIKMNIYSKTGYMIFNYNYMF